jgi:hypothetical protein
MNEENKTPEQTPAQPKKYKGPLFGSGKAYKRIELDNGNYVEYKAVFTQELYEDYLEKAARKTPEGQALVTQVSIQMAMLLTRLVNWRLIEPDANGNPDSLPFSEKNIMDLNKDFVYFLYDVITDADLGIEEAKGTADPLG